MNFQQYANYYGLFHGVIETEIIENCIVYKITRVSWSKSIVLKLKAFSKAYCDNTKTTKPLSKSLMKHFKLESPCTIFKTDDSFSILYGNSLLAFPKSDGLTCVVATQYFVKNTDVFKNFMNKAECISENIYYYKSSVVYLDGFDIPFPGGDYFSDRNSKNSICRICFIIDEQDLFRIREFVRNLENVNDIYSIPLKTKCVNAVISQLIDCIPIDETFIPTVHYEYTNIIVKRLCFKNPNFIIQDILNSCLLNNDIGIVIEYPVCLSYVSLNKSNFPRRYYCFSINCHQPKQFIHVPSPFDRYYLYNHGIKDINWTTIYYNNNNNTSNLKEVVIDTNAIGYIYRDTFFCLSHPKLSKVTTNPNRNTKFIFNTLSFNIEDDEYLNIVYMHRYDSEHIIYCVKHKHFIYDMWCLEKSKHLVNNYRTSRLPYLVYNWAKFVIENKNSSSLNFGDLHFIKLMYILARHKICFSLRESETREIIYEKQKDIIFQVEKNAIDYINNLRLDFMITKEEKKQNTCSLS